MVEHVLHVVEEFSPAVNSSHDAGTASLRAVPTMKPELKSEHST